jgi:hypothetical protein
MQRARQLFSSYQKTNEDQKTPEFTLSKEELIKLNPEAVYTISGDFALSYAKRAIARCEIAKMFPSEVNKAACDRISEFALQEIKECEKLKPGR